MHLSTWKLCCILSFPGPAVDRKGRSLLGTASLESLLDYTDDAEG